MIFDFIRNLTKGNTLYYPGCLTKFVAKDIGDNYRKILRKAGIDFIEISDVEFCCGSPVLKAGYQKDFVNLAKKNLSVFKDFGIGRIVTSCPACSFVLTQRYTEALGDSWDIQVEHIVETLVRAGFKPKSSKRKVVTYHDPCHLGKQRGIYEEPRELIVQAGCKIKEMDLNRVNSFCCGGGGGLRANNQELAGKVAKERLAMAREVRVKNFVTACPLCFLHLKDSSDDINIIELSQILK